MNNRKVLISSVGVVGPCLAYWLLRYGFETVLIERAPSLRTGGYIIDFWGRGFDIAEMMGLLPALQREGYRIDEIRIEDTQGRRTGGFNVRAVQEVLRGRFPSILRSDLARLIYESLEGKVRTIFGDTVKAIEQEGDAVLVRSPLSAWRATGTEIRARMSAMPHPVVRSHATHCAVTERFFSSSSRATPNCGSRITTSRHRGTFCGTHSVRTGGSARISSGL